MANETPKTTTKKTATRAKAVETTATVAEPKAKKVAKATAVVPATDKPAAEKKAAVAKKPAAAKASPPATTPRKSAEKKSPAKTGKLSDEQRYRMIAEAAYYRAESCQFKSDPLRDWIEAERDIAILLREIE